MSAWTPASLWLQGMSVCPASLLGSKCAAFVTKCFHWSYFSLGFCGHIIWSVWQQTLEWQKAKLAFIENQLGGLVACISNTYTKLYQALVHVILLQHKMFSINPNIFLLPENIKILLCSSQTALTDWCLVETFT